ncbi:tonB-system energizer ExbB [Pseudothioclava nitratireducens]|jgi:biopolymer transport protein ExbB|uniref:tonB-system energizer ExbB n=1 Tax=Pseudothioclava nitratireducens TaxID=1928646 RepID=UPI0023DA68F5|nr:tonB-system energizer ExbB [Defluviimonas nitratireducens]MDF1620149.1 tonB-system energizer ExbB [Defluviimonas nitratireducens]
MSDLVVSDLTPMGMYHNADAVVQAILLILVAASVVSWTVLFAKGVELAAQRVRLGRALMRLRAASGLDALAGLGGAAARMLAEARLEIEASGATLPAAGVKERLALRIARIEAGEGRRAQRGTGVLATIGAVAPFVGLFGTVWGIMNSFVSIAQSQTTNLAVVAPGIAEALLATAVGLGAAIPAVVIYNALGRVVAAQRAGLADAGALVLAIAGRDLDRAQGGA